MPRDATITQESSVGEWGKKIRICLNMTQQELGDKYGISKEDIDLFEHDMPMNPDVKHRLLKALRSSRNAMCQAFPR
ncbi:MAG: hypothetical protein A2144_09375 [Chloroflexi bacterium RBG_16_50_9]|nr:MAG: hypothetical protein A2144_09375 [Chloroflexi bacterium RBG_16_50_9]